MRDRNTIIYRRSLELVDLVARILRHMPIGYGFLADQIRRAAASITLNYLEGCGRSGPNDRRRFFHFAIGSALEVSGTLEVMHRFGVLSRADLTTGQDLCDHRAAMLRRFR